MGEASNEHRTAREKCELLIGEDVTRCNTEAKAEQQRAKKEARVNYQAGIKVPANDPVIVPRTAGGLDVVLYRAHRQWPD